jgi:hypothetical protein
MDFSRTRIATGHEVSATPLTIAIAILCFAVAGHRLPQLARELADDEHRQPAPVTTPAVATVRLS